MGTTTGIEWCDHTFNAWIGCTKVSDACDHCYAETLAKRYGWVKWGAGEPRKRTSEANWLKPIAWNKAAARDGVRRRVFCSSLADVFDAEVSNAWRDDLFDLICKTPNLDWLLLTKRPKVAWQYFEPYRVKGPPSNVWLGTTVEDQKMAELRIRTLLSIPATKHFLSCEPLLGHLNLRCIEIGNGITLDAFTGHHSCAIPIDTLESVPRGALAKMPILPVPTSKVSWVITGGESGPGARPPLIGWVRSLRDQCQAAGVAFHFKQWGEFTPDDPAGGHTSMRRVGKKKAGALLDGREWREFP